MFCCVAFLLFAPPVMESAKADGTRLGKQIVVARGPKVKRGNNAATMDMNDPTWQRALREITKTPEELRAQDAREKRKGIRFPKLIRGNPFLPEVALTFDDGPHPEDTERLLQILKTENVRATFFVVGKMAELYPDLIENIFDGGHEIGNHSFSHVTMTRIPSQMIEVEYRACNDVVKRITGKFPTVCRPPGGDYDEDVINAATRQGLTTALWTDDPADYASPGSSVIAERIIRRVKNGGVILLHSGITQTMDVLPQIIRFLKAKNYKFVTCSEMLRNLNRK